MLAEIVLPAGTDRITVGDIPELFAFAIHPEVPDDEPRQLTELKKMPLTDAAKLKLCGNVAGAFPVSLTNDDMAELAGGVWKNLPPLVLPIAEPEWEPYLEAFQKKLRKDWELNPLFLIHPCANGLNGIPQSAITKN